jgi:FKBP-type peptidyl-prolyl cis-trans isomerase (trigger factor)
MILRHAILLKTPMGQQILTPNTVLDDQLDAVLANIKMQLQAQGIDPKQLVILTDIELEEGEYEIINLDEKSVDNEN